MLQRPRIPSASGCSGDEGHRIFAPSFRVVPEEESLYEVSSIPIVSASLTGSAASLAPAGVSTAVVSAAATVVQAALSSPAFDMPPTDSLLFPSSSSHHHQLHASCSTLSPSGRSSSQRQDQSQQHQQQIISGSSFCSLCAPFANPVIKSDHRVCMIPLNKASLSQLPGDTIRALCSGTYALHLEEETGRSAIVFLMLEQCLGTLIWCRGTSSGLKSTFSSSSSGGGGGGSSGGSHTRDTPSPGRSFHSALYHGHHNNSSTRKHAVTKEMQERLLHLVVTRYDARTTAPPYSAGLEEGFVDLMHAKEASLTEPRIDLSVICRKAGVKSADIDPRSCLKLTFGSSLTENRSLLFILPHDASVTWARGLRSLIKLLRQQSRLTDKRMTWLKYKYLQLYYNPVNPCTHPTPADAIKSFGGRKWTLTGLEIGSPGGSADESGSRKKEQEKSVTGSGGSPHSSHRSFLRARPSLTAVSFFSTATSSSTGRSGGKHLLLKKKSTPCFAHDPGARTAPYDPIGTGATGAGAGGGGTLSGDQEGIRGSDGASQAQHDDAPRSSSAGEGKESGDERQEQRPFQRRSLRFSLRKVSSRHSFSLFSPFRSAASRRGSSFHPSEDNVSSSSSASVASASQLLLAMRTGVATGAAASCTATGGGDPTDRTAHTADAAAATLDPAASILRSCEPDHAKAAPAATAAVAAAGHKRSSKGWFTSQKNFSFILPQHHPFHHSSSHHADASSGDQKLSSAKGSAAGSGGEKVTSPLLGTKVRTSIAHSSQMNFLEFTELFRSFLIRSRPDIKQLFDKLSQSAAAAGNHDGAAGSSKDAAAACNKPPVTGTRVELVTSTTTTTTTGSRPASRDPSPARIASPSFSSTTAAAAAATTVPAAPSANTTIGSENTQAPDARATTTSTTGCENTQPAGTTTSSSSLVSAGSPVVQQPVHPSPAMQQAVANDERRTSDSSVSSLAQVLSNEPSLKRMSKLSASFKKVKIPAAGAAAATAATTGNRITGRRASEASCSSISAEMSGGSRFLLPAPLPTVSLSSSTSAVLAPCASDKHEENRSRLHFGLSSSASSRSASFTAKRSSTSSAVCQSAAAAIAAAAVATTTCTPLGSRDRRKSLSIASATGSAASSTNVDHRSDHGGGGNPKSRRGSLFTVARDTLIAATTRSRDVRSSSERSSDDHSSHGGGKGSGSSQPPPPQQPVHKHVQPQVRGILTRNPGNAAVAGATTSAAGDEMQDHSRRRSLIWDAIASASIVSNSTGIESRTRCDILTVDQLALFLRAYQKEDCTEQQVRDLVIRHEPDPQLREKHQLSFEGFSWFLLDKENYAFAPEVNVHLDEEMDESLSHYFIATSHNTYLTGHQLKGESSVELYSSILRTGCRCVELDCWDGEDGNPVIYHGHTLTSKISFKKVIQAINESAFAASPFPVILSLENHCSLQQQSRMAQIFVSILGDKLVNGFTFDTDFLDQPRLPTPNQLKHKILIKNKKLRTPILPSIQQRLKKTVVRNSNNPTSPNMQHHQAAGRTNSLLSVASSGSMNDDDDESDDDEDEDDDLQVSGAAPVMQPFDLSACKERLLVRKLLRDGTSSTCNLVLVIWFLFHIPFLCVTAFAGQQFADIGEAAQVTVRISSPDSRPEDGIQLIAGGHGRCHVMRRQ